MFCGSCGRPVETDDSFCSSCGSPVQRGAVPPEAGSAQLPAQRSPAGVNVALGVVAGVLLVFFLLMLGLPTTPSTTSTHGRGPRPRHPTQVRSGRRPLSPSSPSW